MKPELKSEKSKPQGNSSTAKVNRFESKIKQEKCGPKSFEPLDNSKEHLVSGKANPTVVPKKVSEQNFNKIFSDNFLELEEKVDFLLQIFKDHSHKLCNKDPEEKVSTVFEEAWYLFNLNKRMSAAEETIKNLSSVIEELLKESTQRKETFIEESLGLSNETDMENLSTTERINFLKNRNDLLTCFMKVLLKVGSIEDISAKMNYLPKSKELNKANRANKFHDNAKQQELDMGDNISDCAQDALMDGFPEKQLTYSQIQDLFTTTSFLKENPETGCFSNKLHEMNSDLNEISDCRFNRRAEAEKVIEEIKRKTAYKNLKGKFSQVSDSLDDYNKEMYNEKIKFLTNETLLISSLEQIQNDFMAKFDSPRKNLANGNLNNSDHVSVSSLEKNNDSDRVYDTSRYSRKSMFQNSSTDGEPTKKSNTNNTLSSIPEECLPVTKKNKSETTSANTRPFTAPVTTKPPLRSSSGVRNTVPREEKSKTNSEYNNNNNNNNVKSKNKNVLNKKPIVRTP